jgi:hypothetical protein
MSSFKIKIKQILKKEELLYGLLLLASIYVFDYHCIFKALFHIPCPGCGLTRAFQELLQFNFIGALSYNLLAIPLILYFVGLFVSRIYDAIKGTQTAQVWENPQLSKGQFFILIIILLCSWGLNILRGL